MVSGAASGQERERRLVVLGQVSLSFYAVTGAVVRELLERLGHRVEVHEGPHEQIFPLLGDGQIDLMAAVWLPEGHVAYWARYGAQALEIAKLYEGARFFWAVPSYVPTEEVASIEDLSKPTVTERMTKVIQGIGAGATITTFSQKAVEKYGLAQLGYRCGQERRPSGLAPSIRLSPNDAGSCFRPGRLNTSIVTDNSGRWLILVASWVGSTTPRSSHLATDSSNFRRSRARC